MSCVCVAGDQTRRSKRAAKCAETLLCGLGADDGTDERIQ